jgi:hypothetical protein
MFCVPFNNLTGLAVLMEAPQVYDARQLVEFPFRLFFRDFFGPLNGPKNSILN